MIQGIQAECPGLMIGVRTARFDHPPFKPDPARAGDGKLGPGIPEEFREFIPYVYGFGCNQNNPLEMDLAEPMEFINMLAAMNVRLMDDRVVARRITTRIFSGPRFFRPAMAINRRKIRLSASAADRCNATDQSGLPKESVVAAWGYASLRVYFPARRAGDGAAP